MDAFSLPKSNEAEAAARTNAIQEATKYATEVPFRTMQKAFESLEIIKAMVEVGNSNSVTDAGVGALCARTAVMGAFLNVKINAAGLDDKKFVNNILAKGKEIEEKTKALETEILNLVNEKINK